MSEKSCVITAVASHFELNPKLSPSLLITSSTGRISPSSPATTLSKENLCGALYSIDIMAVFSPPNCSYMQNWSAGPPFVRLLLLEMSYLAFPLPFSAFCPLPCAVPIIWFGVVGPLINICSIPPQSVSCSALLCSCGFRTPPFSEARALPAAAHLYIFPQPSSRRSSQSFRVRSVGARPPR